MKKSTGEKSAKNGKNLSPLDKSAEEEIIIAKRMMDDDKPSKSASAKKSGLRIEQEEETRERLKGLPKMVTKDSNTIDLRIDRRMFDGEAVAEADDELSISRSRTIDGSMLSQDRLFAQKKRRKRVVNTDYSLAERYEPDYSRGLTAFQVEKREADGFINLNKNKTGKSYAHIFVSNLFTFFNLIIFIVAAALITVGAKINQMLFLVIAIANTTIGIVQ